MAVYMCDWRPRRPGSYASAHVVAVEVSETVRGLGRTWRCGREEGFCVQRNGFRQRTEEFW